MIEAILSNPLLILGIALCAGFAFGKLLNLVKMPNVTGFVIAGILLGATLFNRRDALVQFDIVNDFALGFVAFVIGAELEYAKLKQIGASILAIVLCETGVAFLLVWLATWAWTGSLPLALILGALASATAPAATVLTIRQMRAKGPLTTTLLAVVGIDDAIALMIYAFAAAFARSALGTASSFSFNSAILSPVLHILGGVAIGSALGLLLIPFIRQVRNQAELLILMCGGIILCDGIATQFNFSELLSNMAFGFIVANFLRSSPSRILIALDQLTPPVYTAFFVLAGAQLQLGTCVSSMFLMGLAVIYTLSRVTGKMSGAALGSFIAKAPPVLKKYIGFGLVSQVGVAIALAVIVRREFGNSGFTIHGFEFSELIVNLLLFTTIFTEIIGPLLTRFAIEKAGEEGKAEY